jgi:hypothetical protein
MLSKICLSVALASALILAPARLPGASCVFSNAPSEKACESGCCANKACCNASPKQTGSPVQPFLKPGADQPNIGAIHATGTVVLRIPDAANRSRAGSSEGAVAHSPPLLALICIRLI